MFSENLLSARSLEYLKKAKEIARSYKDSRVDTDHLMLALLSDENSPLSKYLEKMGIDRKEFYRRVSEYLGKLREQVEKASQQEAQHLIDLRSKIMQIKSDIGTLQVELEKIKGQRKSCRGRWRGQEGTEITGACRAFRWSMQGWKA